MLLWIGLGEGECLVIGVGRGVASPRVPFRRTNENPEQTHRNKNQAATQRRVLLRSSGVLSLLAWKQAGVSLVAFVHTPIKLLRRTAALDKGQLKLRAALALPTTLPHPFTGSGVGKSCLEPVSFLVRRPQLKTSSPPSCFSPSSSPHTHAAALHNTGTTARRATPRMGEPRYVCSLPLRLLASSPY